MGKLISHALLEVLKITEGSESSVYICPAGYPTIGVGHRVLTDDPNLTKVTNLPPNKVKSLSELQILQLLRLDLSIFEAAVNSAVKVTLSQNQYDALVSFAFNIGPTAFRNSTVVKLLNQNKMEEVSREIARWSYVGKKPNKGLFIRRLIECHIFDHPRAGVITKKLNIPLTQGEINYILNIVGKYITLLSK